MPMRLLQTDGSEYRATLADMGLVISPGRKARDLLTTCIQSARPPAWVRCVERTGWQEGTFVFPDETIGETGAERSYCRLRKAAAMCTSRPEPSKIGSAKWHLCALGIHDSHSPSHVPSPQCCSPTPVRKTADFISRARVPSAKARSCAWRALYSAVPIICRAGAPPRMAWRPSPHSTTTACYAR